MKIPSLDALINKPKRRAGEADVTPGDLPDTRNAGTALQLILILQANDSDTEAAVVDAKTAIAGITDSSKQALRASFQAWLQGSNGQVLTLLA